MNFKTRRLNEGSLHTLLHSGLHLLDYTEVAPNGNDSNVGTSHPGSRNLTRDWKVPKHRLFL